VRSDGSGCVVANTPLVQASLLFSLHPWWTLLVFHCVWRRWESERRDVNVWGIRGLIGWCRHLRAGRLNLSWVGDLHCGRPSQGSSLSIIGLDWFWIGLVLIFIRDHGHVCGSHLSELTDYLGENPGGNLGTAQANSCCWLTPIGPELASYQAPYNILWDAVSSQWMHSQQSKSAD